ncbi:hypothetical protein [Prosthecobacter sp.]|uniref:hypothetical protein n=1 Tax=Prosthecobacter sp. TaxID=1965333 RepID=UPI002488D1F4|nr:hypothetical protein [Prosthecobacter sp.]MDI1310766.1 hypothetical protein [Prosthecobacter sp.]
MSECPFIIGKSYRVRSAFKALRDSFVADEVLLFDSFAWSRYDGITGYFFRQPGCETVRIWDLGDDEDILVWRELFEELSEAETDNDA